MDTRSVSTITTTRRRRLRRVLLGAGCLSGVMLLLYAALPWLIPTSWIAGQLHYALSNITGCPVRIERVTLGWRQGVVIEGLTISRKPAYGDGPMLRVGRAQCGFTPLRTFLSGRVDRLVIRDADCWAVIGADGRLNLTDLGSPSKSVAPGTLPSHEWQLDDIRLHLVSNLPDQPELVLDFGSLACQFDSESGEARYSARATLAGTAGGSPSKILWDGQLSIPSLNPDVSLAGGTEFRFAELDLSTLPTWVWPKGLAIASISGMSSGRLATSLDEREGVQFTVDIDLDDVKTRRRDDAAASEIGDLSLDIEGAYRADSRAFQLRRVSLEVPDRLSIRGPKSQDAALAYAPFDRTWLALEFHVATPDVAALLELSSLMPLLQERHVALSGPAAADLSFTAGPDGFRWSLDADLDGVECIAPRIYHHPAGAPARLRLFGEIDARDATLIISDLTADVGEDHLQLQARLPGVASSGAAVESAASISDLLERGEFRAELSIARVERFIESVPALVDRLAGHEIAGPLRAQFEHRPVGSAARLDWRIHLPETFRCVVDPFVRLSGDAPLVASGHVRFPSAAAAQPGQIGLDIRRGESRIRVEAADTAWRFSAGADDPNNADTSPVAIDLHARVPAQVDDVEALLTCVPWITETLSRHAGRQVQIAGSCRADLAFNAALHANERKWRLSGALIADALSVHLGDWLQKPAASPARLEFGWTLAHAGQVVASQAEGAIALAGGRATGEWRRHSEADEVRIDLQVTDAASLGAQSAVLARLIQPYGVTGAAHVEVVGRSSEADTGGSIAADMTGLSFEVPGEFPVIKRAGVPLSGSARIVAASDGDASDTTDTWLVDVTDLHLTTGGSMLDAPAVAMQLVRTDAGDPRSEVRGGRDGPIESREWDLKSVTAVGALSLLVDGSVFGMNPKLDEWVRRHDFAGRGSATFKVAYEEGGDVALDWYADATRLHVNAAPHWMKPAGVAVESRGVARLSLDRDGAVRVSIERTEGRIGDTRVVVRGECVLDGSGDGPALGPWTLDVQADSARLDEWALLITQLESARPTGSATVHLRLDGESRGVRWQEGNMRFANAAFELAGEHVWLDGDLAFTPERVSSNALQMRVGDSDAVVLGAIDSPLDAPSGELVIQSDRLDVDELGAWFQRASAGLPSASSSSGPDDPDRLWRLVDAASIEARIRSEKAWFTEPTTRRRFLVDELTGSIQLAGGVLDCPVRCSVNGGVIDGTIGFDRNARTPLFRLDYEARDVRPLDAGTDVDVRPYLALTFPGLEPTGPITLIDSTRQRLLEPAEQKNYPVGSGELIIEGGVVTGKAAPDYITQLFPRLDFARFEFTYMHDWFEKFADGGVEHHFVFHGPVYHIYADGVSTAQGRIRYEVGVDFLASFDKESWAKTGQGRLPLFIKEGVITPDGRLAGETVRYVPLWKLVNTIFVSNNIIETSYLALRERLRRSAK